MDRNLLSRATVVAALVLALPACKLLAKKKGGDDGGPPASTGATPTLATGAPTPKPQAAAKQKVARISELERKLPARPTETLKPPPPGALKVGGSRPTLAVIWVVPDSLEKHRFDLMDIRFDESGSTETTCYLAADKAPADVKSDEGSAFEACAGFKYVMLIRPKAYTAPNDKDDRTFTPGSVDADVFLFEVDSGSALGGFGVRAKNSERFKAKAGELHPAAQDLGFNLQDAIASRWEKLAKNTEFPKADRPGQ